MDLSVMFFGADDAGSRGGHAGKYDEIIAIAREADALGFTAIWTPERHFQQVGQVFPSPPVLAAALAVATERIALRAGSVVLPLHHPLRVFEDWAVVDNLSHGRVGVSVATGWHSADFVLAPDSYANRRALAFEGITTLRRLWAGEPMTLPDGTNRPVTVRPQPRPVSPWLPIWITASGSLETWITAGRLRANVLSTTIGQTREELAQKIGRYREAYDAAPQQGAPAARGTVTLMAHTYVGRDDAEAASRASAPLRAYLKSYVAQAAASRDADGRTVALGSAQLDQLTDFAVRRYLAWGSLLAAPETCGRMLADLSALGCDEVACFIDFGLASADVLASLRRLASLRKEMAA
jgi:natural product biosynthesis luciferase-like monooxygenase protein